MFDAVRDISLRTIILVAVIVWATLAAIWFLSLGPAPVTPTTSARQLSSHSPSGAVPESTESGAAGGSGVPQEPAPGLATSGQDVVVSTQPDQAPEAASNPPRSEGSFALQVGAFHAEEGARTLLERIKADGFPAFLRSSAPADPLYRVMVGPFPDRQQALSRQESLKARGIDSFVKELK